MKKTLFSITFLLFLNSCFQESEKTYESGNLWKITAKNGTESYIFGTIHLYPRNELEFSENAVSNLKKCKVLALEIDLTNISEQRKLMDFEMPNYIKKSYNAVFSEYGDELISMENQLIQMARDYRLTITGLETTDERLDVMKKLDEIEIPDSEMHRDRMLKDFQLACEMYKKESIGALKDSLANQNPGEISELLIDQRNRNWLDDIMKLLEKESTFIAVGVGHLGGKEGLLSLLYDKGYEPTRIK